MAVSALKERHRDFPQLPKAGKPVGLKRATGLKAKGEEEEEGKKGNLHQILFYISALHAAVLPDDRAARPSCAILQRALQ